MATETETPAATDDEFGKGIFEDEPKVELSEREMAIARGEDPDAEPLANENETEEPGADDQEADESDEQVEAEEQETDEAPREVEKRGEGADPFSAEDRELAKRYEISDDELKELGSPAALRAVTKRLDRLAGGRSEEEQTAGGPENQSASDAATDGAASDQSEVLGFDKLDPSKYEGEFDEETQTIVKSVRQTQDALEKVMGTLKQQSDREAASEAQRNRETFHDVLDENPDLYGVSIKDGKPVELSQDHLAAREQVREAAETIHAGIVSRGGNVPPLKDLIVQAMRSVHGDQSKKQEPGAKSADRQQALRKQSAKRRTPGTRAAATRRKETAPPDDDSPEALAAHPAIDKFFRQAQEENGAV